jgi:hypothetical protein
VSSYPFPGIQNVASQLLFLALKKESQISKTRFPNINVPTLAYRTLSFGNDLIVIPYLEPHLSSFSIAVTSRPGSAPVPGIEVAQAQNIILMLICLGRQEISET